MCTKYNFDLFLLQSSKLDSALTDWYPKQQVSNMKTVLVYYISSKEDETFTANFPPKRGFVTFATCQLGKDWQVNVYGFPLNLPLSLCGFPLNPVFLINSSSVKASKASSQLITIYEPGLGNLRNVSNISWLC